MGSSTMTLLLTLLLLGISCNTVSAASSSSSIQYFDSKDDFDEKVVASDGVWLVQFCPKHCTGSTPQNDAYSKMADLVKGVMNVGMVDMVATPEIGESYKQSSNGKSTFYMFSIDKSSPREYKGKADPESLVQAMMDETIQLIQHRAGGIPSGGSKNNKSSSSGRKKKGPNRVVDGTKANYEEVVLNNPNVVLVAFTAPWCGYCKKLKPEWDEAAAQLYGQGVTLVNVDATQEEALAKRYGVTGYPSIKFFPGGKKTHKMAKDLPVERETQSIVGFALKLADETGVAAPIAELVSQSVLQETCGEAANQICVLAALPHILESTAAGREKYRDTLAAVQKQFRGSAFRFLWFEGGEQLELEGALELTFGYPAIVAVSLERQAYSVSRGSFSEKSITGFLNGVTTGRQKTVKLSPEQSAKLVVQTVEPWDGKDGAPIEEEEMSLDEIMGWGDDDDDDKKGEL